MQVVIIEKATPDDTEESLRAEYKEASSLREAKEKELVQVKKAELAAREKLLAYMKANSSIFNN